MKSYYKYEIAEALGISSSTLKKWLRPHQPHLQELGNPPTAKILNPAAVRYLCHHFCIDENDLK